MNSQRLEQLKKYLTEDPSDPFNHYALALEYLKTDTSKSMQLFSGLLLQYPNYLPTYYHAAKLYLELGMKEKAIETVNAGIERALAQNEWKTKNELSSLLNDHME